MSKINLYELLLILILTALYTSFLPNKIYAQTAIEEFNTSAEYIEQYNVKISISPNGDIDVEEKITHIKDTPHHGIYRDIRYTMNKKYGLFYKTKITVNNVEAYNLMKRSVDKTASNYTTSYEDNYLRIKIGDSNHKIHGPYQYTISYTVDDIIKYQDGYEEFYWNVIPHYWDIPIRNASFTIIGPEPNMQDYLCLIGPYGSNRERCILLIDDKNTQLKNPVTLGSREGITVALSYPPRTFHRTATNLINTLTFFWPLFLVIPVIIIMHFIWIKYGRDERPRTIYPMFTPPDNLDPLIGGYIYKQKIEPEFITALIIEIAIQGYITIEKKNKAGVLPTLEDEFVIHRTSKALTNSPKYMKTIVTGLFHTTKNNPELYISTKELKKSDFYIYINRVKAEVIEEAMNLGYINKESEKLSKLSNFKIKNIILFMIFIIMLWSRLPKGRLRNFLTGSPTGIFIIVAICLSVVIISIYGYYMKKRSKKGTEIYSELLGLKKYIETAEINKIKFHNDTQKYSEIYETLLPYAIVFGLEEKWAQKFDGLYKTPPGWYNIDKTVAFNSYILTSHLSSSFANSIGRSYSPPTTTNRTGLGGGGFSGGGGGGGGGGSW